MLRQVSRQVFISLAASCWSASICLRTYARLWQILSFHLRSVWSAGTCRDGRVSFPSAISSMFAVRSWFCTHGSSPYHSISCLDNSLQHCCMFRLFLFHMGEKERSKDGRRKHEQYKIQIYFVNLLISIFLIQPFTGRCGLPSTTACSAPWVYLWVIDHSMKTHYVSSV